MTDHPAFERGFLYPVSPIKAVTASQPEENTMTKTLIPEGILHIIAELDDSITRPLESLGVTQQDMAFLLMTLERPPASIPKTPKAIIYMTAEAWSLRPSEFELRKWSTHQAGYPVSIGKHTYSLRKVISTIMTTEDISREAAEREAYSFILMRALNRLYQHYRSTARRAARIA